jgi:hypothetical protein
LAALVVVGAALLIVSAGSAGSVIAHPINSDPYTNDSSQHKAQVEPDNFGYGDTIVSVTQTGRFFDGGSSNIAWSTSTNGGHTWTHGVFPGTTIFEGGPWARISDPAIAYDPMHDVWMASLLGIDDSASGAALLTSRSEDGGLTWDDPVTVSLAPGTFYDKNWITCDTWAQSPYYGHCYTEWDDAGTGGDLLMSTSTDGGLTWSPPTAPAGGPNGLGGQPVVQPNGTVVVPYEGGAGIRAFRSTNGGTSWLASVAVASISEHGVAGNLRTSPLPSAEVAGDGKVYVVWQDCSFRTSCTSNDIVMSTSTDGATWTAKVRIPIDATTSGVDHFIPGIGVDRDSSGGTTRLALGYHYYPVANCNSTTCDLTVGFVSSQDAGATWTAPQRLYGPMKLSWVASTNQGRMVGDYMSTAFAAGKAHPVFAIAKPPAGGVFDERMATASIDITAGGPTHRTRHDPVRYRAHSRPPDEGVRTAN